MSLLREIQNDAVSSETDVSALLRKCKILAARLGNAEFKAWIESELNGYDDIAALPDYRKLSVESVGHFSGPFGSGMRNAPIPSSCLPQEFRDHVTHSFLSQPISHYSSLLVSRKRNQFQENWPADVVALVGRSIYQNMVCVSAWKVIPANSIAALCDTIRTRVLNFCLEIESQDPNAGEAPLNQPPLPQERVSQVFNTYISGSVQNVASGGTDFSQHAESHGLANELLTKLIDAIASAPAAEAGKTEMAAAATRMRDSVHSPSFAEQYRQFMSVLADHIQVFGPICAPYLPALASFLR